MFSIIVAVGKNGEIGKDNKLLWHIPEDLKNFKRITTNKKIVMGRKTFESIGRPLPNRENIVLTRKSEEHTVDKIIEKYSGAEEEIFIIGGSQIYESFLEKGVVDKLYISHVDFEDGDADAYFPAIEYANWKKTEEQNYENWKFCVYEKIKGE